LLERYFCFSFRFQICIVIIYLVLITKKKLSIFRLEEDKPNCIVFQISTLLSSTPIELFMEYLINLNVQDLRSKYKNN
jgi:hypothetical protein